MNRILVLFSVLVLVASAAFAEGKTVWFKSPWGNKALPVMHIGTDSVLMKYVPDDASTCGWFYGDLTSDMLKKNAVQDVYFTRNKASWVSYPAKSGATIDISKKLESLDSLYIDGTAAKASVASQINETGDCFDPTLRIHIYNPWRTNFVYKDSAVYLQVDGIVEMQDSSLISVVRVARDNSGCGDDEKKCDSIGLARIAEYSRVNKTIQLKMEKELESWSYRDFSDSIVKLEAWKNAKIQIFRNGDYDFKDIKYFEKDDGPQISSLFPKGVYEIWLNTSTNLNELDVFYYQPEHKTIRFLTPWSRIPTSMVLVDLKDTVKMGPFSKDTCGWFEANYYKHVTDWSVYFKETSGLGVYSNDGIAEKGRAAGDPISLDSMMALYDTVWVYPYPVYNASPKFSNVYPNRLGPCPSMTISALIMDWAGEAHDDSIDIDFGKVYDGNDFTEVKINETAYRSCNQGLVTGMVKDTLIIRDSLIGAVPERVDSASYPWEKCAAAREMERWFVPEVVAKGRDGTEYTNAVCKDIQLELDNEGFWQADYTNENDCNDTINKGFYPLDDFKFLDVAETVENPKWDSAAFGAYINGSWKKDYACRHNYSFTMKIAANFKYVKGQYFEFRGDDDVWVYINNKLVVDLGGVHEPLEGAVNLDTLNLVEGKMYPFNIFYSERNASGSNFRMRTSINLETESSYQRKMTLGSKNIEVELRQLDVSQSMGCDASVAALRDTILAPSRFLLKSLGGDSRVAPDGEWLKQGVNYGGITISEDLAHVVIDTNEIVRQRSLSAGTYELHFFLATDETQSQYINFTIPEYPLPTISFADSTGKLIDGDTLKASLGKFVYIPTKVYVAVLYFGEICTDCFALLDIATKDSLKFTDDNGNPVSRIEFDSTGYASFNVMGIGKVDDGMFTLSGEGQVQNTLYWTEINLDWPKYPLANIGEMYDRNGDGHADSLFIEFNEKFGKRTLVYTDWLFGDSTEWHTINGTDKIAKNIKNKNSFIETGDAFTKDVFTGLSSGTYKGVFKYKYRYYDPDVADTLESDTLVQFINEKIGAILTNGTVEIKSKTIRTLTLDASEATISNKVKNLADAFEFKVWRKGVEVSRDLKISKVKPSKDGTTFELYFTGDEGHVLPAVGDSVRLTPKILPDLNGNTPHKDNPWVRIIGDQDLAMDVTEVVLIDPTEVQHKKKMSGGKVTNAAQPYVVPTEWTIEDIVDEFGLPGQVLSFDMRELGITARDTGLSLDSVRIIWDVYYYTNIGQYVVRHKGSIACSDDLYGGDCTRNPGKVFLAWNCLSEEGRVVGSGAYIAKVEWGVYVGHEKIGKKMATYVMGVRHGRKK